MSSAHSTRSIAGFAEELLGEARLLIELGVGLRPYVIVFFMLVVTLGADLVLRNKTNELAHTIDRHKSELAKAAAAEAKLDADFSYRTSGERLAEYARELNLVEPDAPGRVLPDAHGN